MLFRSQRPRSSLSKLMEFLLTHLHLIQYKLNGVLVQISGIFLCKAHLSRTLSHNVRWFRLSKFWLLSPQLSKAVVLCWRASSPSMVDTVPPGRGPEWLQGSPHLFLFYQGSQTCTACCSMSKIIISYILCSSLFFNTEALIWFLSFYHSSK